VLVSTTTLKPYNSSALCSNTSWVATFTLPPAVAWLSYNFLVGSANTLTISANWTDKIRHKDIEGSAWWNATNNNEGETMSLECFKSWIWSVVNLEWTWQLT
jgi:hypothetical protein